MAAVRQSIGQQSRQKVARIGDINAANLRAATTEQPFPIKPFAVPIAGWLRVKPI